MMGGTWVAAFIFSSSDAFPPYLMFVGCAGPSFPGRESAGDAESVASVRGAAKKSLGEGFLEEHEQPRPGLLSLLGVVDRRVRRAPAVERAGVDLDFRRPSGLREGVAQDGLCVGLLLVVVRGDRDEEARLRLRDEQVRAVRLVGHEPAAVECRDGAD